MGRRPLKVITWAMLWMLTLAACDGFNGGIEAVSALPAASLSDVGAAAESDTAGDAVTRADALMLLAPQDGATVDGDWLPVVWSLPDASTDVVTVDILNAAGDAVTTRAAASAGAGEVVVTGLAPGAYGVRVLAGDEMALAAINVEVVVPAVGFVSPAVGAALPEEAPLSVALDVSDFTLLPQGQLASGPRQGRVALAVDGLEPSILTATEVTLPALTSGAHSLTATLVDLDGVPWPGATQATVPFRVGSGALLTILAPHAAPVHYGERLDVVVGVVGFALDGQDGDGHGTWRATLDGDTVAVGLTGPSHRLDGLMPGPHTLAIELRSAAGQPLQPVVAAVVDFDVVALSGSLTSALPVFPIQIRGDVLVSIWPRSVDLAPVMPPASWGEAGIGLASGMELGLNVDGSVVSMAPGSLATALSLATGAHAVTPIVAASESAAPVSVARSLQVFDPRPRLRLGWPYDGATVPQTFPLTLELDQFPLTNGRRVLVELVPLGGLDSLAEPVGDVIVVGETAETRLMITAPITGPMRVQATLMAAPGVAYLPLVRRQVDVSISDIPTARILSPADGSSIGAGSFAATLSASAFTIVPPGGGGPYPNDKGHYHLFIDGIYQGFHATDTVVIDPAATLPPLSAGLHTLRVALHKGDYAPVPGAIDHTITFTYDPTPSVVIVAPGAGDSISAAGVEVVVATKNFEITEAAGQFNVAGQGHLHVFVDDVYIGFETRPRFWVDLPNEGSHTVQVALHNNDHSVVPNTAPAAVSFISSAAPRLTPALGSAFAYGRQWPLSCEAANISQGAAVDLRMNGQVFGTTQVDARGRCGPTTVPWAGTPGAQTFAVGLAADGDGGLSSELSVQVLGVKVPSIRWLSGGGAATADTFSVAVTDFVLHPDHVAGPAVPGVGGWLLVANERRWGPFYAATIPRPVLPAGVTSLEAVLVHCDGQPLLPNVAATLPLDQVTTGPGLWLPGLDGVTVMGPALPVIIETENVAATWFRVELDGVTHALWPADRSPDGTWGTDGIGETGGAIGGGGSAIRVRGELTGLTPGPRRLTVTALDAELNPIDGVPVAEAQPIVGLGKVPSLELIQSSAGSLSTANDVIVEVELGGYTLDGLAYGRDASAGTGVLQFFVDGRFTRVGAPDSAGASVNLGPLSSGPHTVIAVVADSRGRGVLPRVEARLDLIVGP